MSIAQNTRSILKALDKYSEVLTGMNEEQFQRSPAEGVWSYSEVYSHILQSNFGSLIAIERCIYGNKSASGRLKWQARLILFFGRLPPGKIKAPDKLAAMVRKISLEEASNDFIKFRRKLLEIVPLIRDASPTQKIKHPRLGMLNARQWLRFIEIHTHHHLQQLKRIRRILSNN